jgi:alkylation response protein AidB-like acyl-CoA dehydrogenase
MTFDGVRVSAADRLGPEGGGWPVVRDALVNERVGAPRHIRAARVLDEVVQAARTAGRLDAAGLRAAGEARAVCVAARALVHKVRQMGATGDPGALAYLARAAVVQAERAVAEVAAELAGPDDIRAGALTDGEFRTALIAGLGGGSYEMQLNLTARLWLKLPKAA